MKAYTPVEHRGPAFAWIGVGLLFVASGCAALIYEVVWFQLLRLVIGGSWVSMGILLASFMGGMCLGSFALAWVVPARWHPLRVYAVLELAIGAIGGTLPWWLPKLSDWYLRVADESLAGISARAAVAAAAILPATALMGATLPAVARWVKSTPAGLARAWRLLRSKYDRCGDRVPRGRLLAPERDRYDRRQPCRRGDQRLRGAGGLFAGLRHSLPGGRSKRRRQRLRICRNECAGDCLPGDRAFRLCRARGRGGLDAALVATVRLDRLHLCDHSRCVPRRAGYRQHGGRSTRGTGRSPAPLAGACPIGCRVPRAVG